MSPELYEIYCWGMEDGMRGLEMISNWFSPWNRSAYVEGYIQGSSWRS